MFANLVGAVIVAILIGRNEDLRAAANVRFWPIADMPKDAIDVAIGGKADMAYCTAHVRF